MSEPSEEVALVPAYTKPHFWIMIHGAEVWNRWARDGLGEAEGDAEIIEEIGSKLGQFCSQNMLPCPSDEIDFCNTEWKLRYDDPDVPEYIYYKQHDGKEWWKEPRFILKDFIFLGRIGFTQAVFHCPMDFNDAQFEDEFIASNAKFLGGVDFTNTQFIRKCDFCSANFHRLAFFNNAQFHYIADFNNVTFFSLASFRYAKFQSSAQFQGTKFESDAVFEEVEFYFGAFFRKTQFIGSAYLQYANFQCNVYFNNATFGDPASFKYVQFHESVDFEEVQFHGETSFQKAQFDEDANFLNATFHQVPVLTGAKCEGVWMFSKEETYWAHPKNVKNAKAWQTIEIGYSQIRKRMEELKLHHWELFFHAKEMEAQRQQAIITDNPKAILYWLYKTTSDYGQSIAKPSVGIGLVLLYALAGYWILLVYYSCIPTLPQSPFSYAVSFALNNALPIDVLDKGLSTELFKYHDMCKENIGCKRSLALISGIQKLLSFFLWFLLGLGIRNRFKLR